MVVIGAVISTYYNVIIAFTVFYFFASFNSKLPWTECHESWQSPGCTNIAGKGSTSMIRFSQETQYVGEIFVVPLYKKKILVEQRDIDLWEKTCIPSTALFIIY